MKLYKGTVEIVTRQSKEALDAFIESTQQVVCGCEQVKLYKGTVEIATRQSKTGLFSSELRSLKSKGFDQRDSGPATKIHGLQFELLGKRTRQM